MHPRIQQLADQAGLPEYITGEISPRIIEEFAKSIILACADVAEGGPGCVCCTTGTGKWIKFYFGVEE